MLNATHACLETREIKQKKKRRKRGFCKVKWKSGDKGRKVFRREAGYIDCNPNSEDGIGLAKQYHAIDIYWGTDPKLP